MEKFNFINSNEFIQMSEDEKIDYCQNLIAYFKRSKSKKIDSKISKFFKDIPELRRTIIENIGRDNSEILTCVERLDNDKILLILVVALSLVIKDETNKNIEIAFKRLLSILDSRGEHYGSILIDIVDTYGGGRTNKLEL